MKYSQKNIEQLFRLIGSFPGQNFRQAEYFDFIQTKGSVWPNQLFNLKSTENSFNDVLDLIEKESLNGSIPSLLMLKPDLNSQSLSKMINKRNYKSSLWYAMTHNLEHITTLNPDNDFQIIQVESENDLSNWLSIVEEELMGNFPLSATIFNSLLNDGNCSFFLGLYKQQPVATSFLFVNDKIAGVYLVSTKKSARKKGFGLKMTNECLTKSKELQCKAVEIQATELGKGIYKFLGFTNQGKINVFRINKN